MNDYGNNVIENLKQEIEVFSKREASLTEKGLDWELDYPFWNNLYSAVFNTLSQVPLSDWNAERCNLLLRVVSWDHESENILDLLTKHPEKLLILASHALSFNNYEARWQIAAALGKVAVKNIEIENQLTKFLDDENEYVITHILHK